MPVYFIRAGEAGPVKIGWAADAEDRRKQLQTSHHEPLRVIRTIECRRQAERWLQDRFDAWCLHGEWFQFQPEMATIEPPDLGPPIPKQPKRPRLKNSSSLGMCWAGDPCAECRAYHAAGLPAPSFPYPQARK